VTIAFARLAPRSARSRRRPPDCADLRTACHRIRPREGVRNGGLRAACDGQDTLLSGNVDTLLLRRLWGRDPSASASRPRGPEGEVRPGGHGAGRAAECSWTRQSAVAQRGARSRPSWPRSGLLGAGSSAASRSLRAALLTAAWEALPQLSTEVRAEDSLRPYGRRAIAARDCRSVAIGGGRSCLRRISDDRGPGSVGSCFGSMRC
jgi:hypothetical protein